MGRKLQASEVFAPRLFELKRGKLPQNLEGSGLRRLWSIGHKCHGKSMESKPSAISIYGGYRFCGVAKNRVLIGDLFQFSQIEGMATFKNMVRRGDVNHPQLA